MTKKDIPNILTIGRFALVIPLIISTAFGKYFLAIFIFTISGITDILDGFIARKYNFVSNFGKLIDPLADKLTQISMLTILVIKNIIPLWILIIVILKEFLLISGASFLYGKEQVVSSKWFGKLTTVVFYSAIVSSLFLKEFEALHILNETSLLLYLDDILFYIAVVLTIFSLVMYIKTFCFYKYFKDAKQINNINK